MADAPTPDAERFAWQPGQATYIPPKRQHARPTVIPIPSGANGARLTPSSGTNSQ